MLNYPVSSGLNPSTGTLSVAGPTAGIYSIRGSVTAGANTGALLNTSIFVTGTNPGARGTALHPVTLQKFTNTAPLQLLRNFG